MFSFVVNLYREVGRPPVTDCAAFSYMGPANERLAGLLRDMKSMPNCFGYFDSLENNGKSVEFEFFLPSNESGRFHADLKSFIEATPSINSGVFPLEFYIVDLDYYSKDLSSPREVINLRRCCEFVGLLSRLAAGFGKEDDSSNKMVFILAADGRSPAKTISLRPRIDAELINYSINHIKILSAMLDVSLDKQVHIEEKRIVLQSSIAETISSAGEGENPLTHLIKGWDEVLQRYRHNFQAFLHQFSFEKTRKEIAATELEHASKVSSTLGDIAGKLLALPVSLGGLALLGKAHDAIEVYSIAVGLVLVSVVLILVLINQKLQVDRLFGSINIFFGKYSGEVLEKLPSSLKRPILDAKEKLKKQERFLKFTFIVFFGLALIPGGAAIFVLLDKNYSAKPDQENHKQIKSVDHEAINGLSDVPDRLVLSRQLQWTGGERYGQ